MSTDKGTPAAYYYFEGEGPQWKAPEGLMGAQKWTGSPQKQNKEKAPSTKAPSTKAPAQKKAPRTGQAQPPYEAPPEGRPKEEGGRRRRGVAGGRGGGPGSPESTPRYVGLKGARVRRRGGRDCCQGPVKPGTLAPRARHKQTQLATRETKKKPQLKRARDNEMLVQEIMTGGSKRRRRENKDGFRGRRRRSRRRTQGAVGWAR